MERGFILAEGKSPAENLNQKSLSLSRKGC